MSEIDRRALLTTAATAALVGAAAAAPSASALPAANVPSADFLALQRLAAEMRDVTYVRGQIVESDDPVGAAAGDARVDDLDKQVDVVTQRILSKPAETLSDLVDRAAVMLFWCDDGCDGAVFDNPDKVLLSENGVRFKPDYFEKAAGQLASAVFAMAKIGGANV